VSLVHLIQAWLLLLFPHSGDGIALASLMWVADNLAADGSDRMFVSLAMMACADIALLSVFNRRLSPFVRLALLGPQQFILVIVAGFVAWCVVQQTYADGTQRPWEFILNDQIGWIGLAFAHTGAVIRSSSGR